jgi:dipeptidase E
MKTLNLAFYCDQATPDDEAIDHCVLRMLAGRGDGRRIAYLPSGPEPDKRFFLDRVTHYARLGLDLAIFHDVDEPQTPDTLEALFTCDAIHLTGGQTAPFLRRLKRSGMLGPLRDWALAGGILVGTSAGAIILTPTIAVDALFSGGRPEDMADAEALDLVSFEFFPHFDDASGQREELLRYSIKTHRPIVACRDGEGLVVTGGRAECIGTPLWIAGGALAEDAQAKLDSLFLP